MGGEQGGELTPQPAMEVPQYQPSMNGEPLQSAVTNPVQCRQGVDEGYDKISSCVFSICCCNDIRSI